ncbi:MAG: hypothetical protein JW834_03985 [Candidatus Diapherotrites archaeon]|nr:hypothetical protein [Candidatus Diapherotrites archaeon]
MSRILAFGDSNVWGRGDPGGGWVRHLRAFFEKKGRDDKDYYPVYNLGVSGDTTACLLKHVEPEILHRIFEDEHYTRKERLVLLFGIGTNDALFWNERGEHSVPLNRFGENVREIIRIASKYSSAIVFLGLTPVDDSKVDPIPWLPEASYRMEFVRQYNDALKSVCEEEGVHFVDILPVMKGYTALLSDGVHLNRKGHKRLFELVKGFLVSKGIT